MGNSLQSNLAINDINEMNQVINNQATTIVNNNKQNCTTRNDFRLGFGTDLNGHFCPFYGQNVDISVTQVATASCSLQSENLNNINSQIENDLKASLQNYLEQNASSQQGFLAHALSIQFNTNYNKETISNAIVNNINSKTLNNCSAILNANNNGVVMVCGTFNNSKLNFQQDASVTSITSCINQTIVQTVANNSELADLLQKTDQKLLSQQNGLESIFGGMIGIIIAVAILIAIIVGLIILYKVFKKKKPETTTEAASTKVETTTPTPTSAEVKK
ncbi:MAG: hypothetical protein QW478_00700 [Candidatus Micrarchaeaceae archaeon]